MKKLFAAFIPLILIFSGCSNSDSVSEKLILASLLNSTEQGETVSINVSSQAVSEESRALFPEENLISEYLNDVIWSVSFEPSEKNTYKEARGFYLSDIKADSEGSISFKTIRKGSYDIHLEGNCSKNGESYNFYADRSNVDLAKFKTIDMSVSAIQEGFGEYEINVYFLLSNWSERYLNEDNVTIDLIPLTKKNPVDKQVLNDNKEVTVSTVDDKVIFTVKNKSGYQVPAGFYKISVLMSEYDDGLNIYICDNIPLSQGSFAMTKGGKAEGSVEAYYSYHVAALRSSYYATTDSTAKGNGLYKATAGYIWDIIRRLTELTWNESIPAVNVLCNGFELNVAKYNEIIGSLDPEKSTFCEYGSISVSSESTGCKYEFIGKKAVFLDGSAVFDASGASSKDDMTVKVSSSSTAEKCYLKNKAYVTSGDFFTNVFYIDDVNYYKTEPFYVISESMADIELEFSADYTFPSFTDGDFLVKLQDSRYLSFYVYNEAKKLYYREPAYGAKVVSSTDSNGKKVYKFYIVSSGLSNLSEMSAFCDLHVSAKDPSGKDYNDIEDMSLDWYTGKYITFSAEYNTAKENSAFENPEFEWVLNGKKLSGAVSKINVPYSEFWPTGKNTLICKMIVGNDMVSKTIGIFISSESTYKNWSAYLDEASFSSGSECIVKYYVDGNTADLKTFSFSSSSPSSTSTWSFWTLDDGYLYIFEHDSGSFVSLHAYAMDESTKEFTEQYIPDAVKDIYNHYDSETKYVIADIAKAEDAYYLLLRNIDSTKFRIAVCSSIVGDDSVTALRTEEFSCDKEAKQIAVKKSIADNKSYAFITTDIDIADYWGILKLNLNVEEDGSISLGSDFVGITESNRADYRAAYETFPLKNSSYVPEGLRNAGSEMVYSDLAVIGDKLYATLYSRSSQVDGLTYAFFGAVAVLDIGSDGSLTHSNLYGLVNDATKITYQGEPCTIAAPYGEANPAALFSVSKILAIKEDYLLLQDCGLYVIVDENDEHFYFRNTDRIVYFDLKSNSVDTTKTVAGLTMTRKNVSGGFIVKN